MLKQLERSARSFFYRAKGSHDWDHSLRVHKLCEKIGPVEGADMVVLSAAAYLHDIGRLLEDKTKGLLCHAERGGVLARPVVEKMPLSRGQKENIIHCIISHRFRGKNIPETIEAKTLFDADKLDAIGAVGIARAYLFAGEQGARLHSSKKNIALAEPYGIDDTGYREYVVKLSKIKERMMTEEGRRIARDRHVFMVAFFNRFLEEYEGER